MEHIRNISACRPCKKENPPKFKFALLSEEDLEVRRQHQFRKKFPPKLSPSLSTLNSPLRTTDCCNSLHTTAISLPSTPPRYTLDRSSLLVNYHRRKLHGSTNTIGVHQPSISSLSQVLLLWVSKMEIWAGNALTRFIYKLYVIINVVPGRPDCFWALSFNDTYVLGKFSKHNFIISVYTLMVLLLKAPKDVVLIYFWKESYMHTFVWIHI